MIYIVGDDGKGDLYRGIPICKSVADERSKSGRKLHECPENNRRSIVDKGHPIEWIEGG